MSASTKEKAAGTDEAPKKGKTKLLLIVLVLLLAAGGAAYFFLFSGSAKATEPVSSGTFVTLDPVAVNLAGGGYLKVGVALELTTDGASGGEGGGLDGSKAIDLVISTFSQAAPADVTNARDALKAALQKKIVDAYTEDGKEMVMGIYYTDYVTQ
ncbi:MAG: flagellar basal body-associated protein FliL [Blastococcus sp.]|jgi:flagellar FliL protein